MGDRVGHPVASGALTSVLEICFTYPLEFLKTQLQLSHKAGSTIGSRSYTGMWDVLTYTVRTAGVTGLYRGIPVFFAFAFPRGATRFTTFEFFASHARETEWGNNAGGPGLSAAATLTSGLCAGIVEALVCVIPMNTLQIKLMNDLSLPQPRFKNSLHGTLTLVREGGLRALYQGVSSTLLKTAMNQSIRFTTFEQLKTAILTYQGLNDRPKHERQLHPFVSLLAGGTAGGVSVLLNQPIDVVKSNMQGLEGARFESARSCAAFIWSQGGIRGMYKGLTPRLVRVFFEVGLIFTLYDKIGGILDRMWPVEG